MEKGLTLKMLASDLSLRKKEIEKSCRERKGLRKSCKEKG